jgi:long-chain acyl-CoA synthetase
VNIASLLSKTAAKRPQHTAIIFGEESLTFADLHQKSDALAWGLKQAGLEPGQVCVLMMPNSIDWVLCYYALAKLGAAVLPVNFLYRTAELQHIFSDSGAVAFIGHADHMSDAGAVLADMPKISLRIATGGQAEGCQPLESFMSGQGEFPMHPAKGDDTWAIIYTSGTTGLPKGAMLTHHNLASNAITISDMRQNGPDDILLGVLPLFHIYGQTSSLNASIYLGITLKLWVHFDPDETFRAIQDLESSILIAVPTIYTRLAEMASQSPPKRSSLRFCISGGASLPVEVLKSFEKAYGTTIYEGYGLTECSPVCVENPFGKKTKPGSIGVPIPGFEARIADYQDKPVAAGEVGELQIKGPGVMKGYLNQPQATEETLAGGWLHTGDLARKDEDGYIYIVDRKKEMIIRGGYNVYPREIEEVLYAHPAVLEAAVLGKPHADLGEEVAAFVVLRPGQESTEDDIREFVKQRVAPYKYPRIVRFLEELPKTHSGKIFKRKIKL